MLAVVGLHQESPDTSNPPRCLLLRLFLAWFVFLRQSCYTVEPDSGFLKQPKVGQIIHTPALPPKSWAYRHVPPYQPLHYRPPSLFLSSESRRLPLQVAPANHQVQKPTKGRRWLPAALQW